MNLIDKVDVVRTNGASHWTARCPAHDDQIASLSIDRTDDRYLMFCHAGCDIRDVLKALGLDWSDMFDNPMDKLGRFGDDPLDEYEYRDAEGKLRYVVERLPGKRFRQRRPTPEGDWVWNMDGVDRLLYRLPKFTEAVKKRWILVVEGEKDVHTLEGKGFVATCASGGANGWKGSLSDYLRGAKVAIIPDNDEPGEAYARSVFESLRGQQVHIIHLPGLPPKGDVTDWFMQGHTPEELKDLIVSASKRTDNEPTLCRLSDVRAHDLEWLWSGRIPRHKLSLIGGDPGQGKSYLSLAVLSALSRGDGLPGVSCAEDSLLVTWEDDPHDTIRPRCQGLGADLDRIHVWDANLDPFVLPGVLPRLREYLRKNPGISTIVLDPIVSCMSGSDIYREDQVRDRLGELCSLDRTIIGIMHLVKANSDDERSALNRLLGSRAFTARARSVLLVQNGAARVIKSNVSEIGITQHFALDSQGFRLLAR